MIFVRVVEPVVATYAARSELFKKEEMNKMESDVKSSAEAYLTQVADRIAEGGKGVQTKVILGRVADSLADYADQNHVDLILIATHGRSGVSRWVRGSVADRILRSARVPVMMVRAPGTKGGI